MHVLLAGLDPCLLSAIHSEENDIDTFEVTFGPEDAFDLASREHDLLLVALDIPELDGCHLIRRLRTEGVITPIIGFSQRHSDKRSEALAAGADEVLLWPIDVAALGSRVLAIYRRSGGPVALSRGPLVVDLHAVTAFLRGRPIELTGKETDLLCFLAERAGRPANKRDIHRHLYGSANPPPVPVIDALVSRLRRKLDRAGLPEAIRVIAGAGYAVSAFVSDKQEGNPTAVVDSA
jgi:two-component system cell cycle response regulator CtrA